MIIGIGTDSLEVDRMRRELQGEGSVREAVFTAGEIRYCEAKRYPERHFAARFAAKEALVKALGRGESPPVWCEIEITNDDHGAPRLVLLGVMKRMAAARRVRRAWVSLSHTDTVATAMVVLEA